MLTLWDCLVQAAIVSSWRFLVRLLLLFWTLTYQASATHVFEICGDGSDKKIVTLLNDMLNYQMMLEPTLRTSPCLGPSVTGSFRIWQKVEKIATTRERGVRFAVFISLRDGQDKEIYTQVEFIDKFNREILMKRSLNLTKKILNAVHDSALTRA